MKRMLAKSLEPVARRLRLMVARAVIRLVNDAAAEQKIQVDALAGETREIERYQHYGYSSRPLPGGEAILVAVGGSRDHLVAVADGDRRYRPRNLAPGEVALYTHEGLMLHLKVGKTIEITECGKLQVVAGDVADQLSTMQAMRDIYNSHTHGTGPAPTQKMQ